MIENEHINGYIQSLQPELPAHLYELEKRALEAHVPIIRKSAIDMLRFLMLTRKPKRILEIGTAVGFSSLVMSEYAPQAEIITLEKVAMRLTEARENLKDSKNIAVIVGDANDTLRFLAGSSEKEPEEIYVGGKTYTYPEYVEAFGKKMPYSSAIIPEFESYDFIFMDAAKGQYMNFLEPVLKLLKPGGMLVTDNVLQDGLIAESKYTIERRDRTIHKRMREYLHHITHCEQLETIVMPMADGMSLSIKKCVH